VAETPADQTGAAVIGATGATGRVIARELLGRGVPVRVVSRSGARLERDFADTPAERVVADVLDPAAAGRAAEGCGLVFDCVGVPLGSFAQHLDITRNLIDAAGAAGARLILISGYWSQAPAGGAIAADTPPKPTDPYSRVRIEQEQTAIDAGACVVILPDFFGPGAGVSVLNDAIETILTAGSALWPGDPRAARDFIYIPDAGAPIVRLALDDRSFGRRWVLAGSGVTTPRDALLLAAQRLKRRARVKRVSPVMMRLGAMIRKDVRLFKPVYPIYNASATFDDDATRDLIGDWPRTGYGDAIPTTIDWLKDRRR